MLATYKHILHSLVTVQRHKSHTKTSANWLLKDNPTTRLLAYIYINLTNTSIQFSQVMSSLWKEEQGHIKLINFTQHTPPEEVIQYKLVFGEPPGPKGCWTPQLLRYYNVIPIIYISVASNHMDIPHHLLFNLTYCPLFPTTLSPPFSWSLT